MKNICIILFMFLQFLSSSCFVFVPSDTTKRVESRLKKHNSDIFQSDFSKINFKGIYLTVTKNNDSTIYISSFFKFFANGEVFESNGLFGRKPSITDIGNYKNGEWCAYYIKENKIYIEKYNRYTGYFFRVGSFNESYTQFKINGYATLHRRLFSEELSILYKLEYPN